MFKTISVWLGLLVGLLAVTSSAFAQTGNAAEGKKIFSAKCVMCHGQDGSGNTPVGKSLKAADLRSPDVQKKPDVDFYTQVEKGKGKMPPFGAALNQTQITNVIAYLREIGGKSAK